MVVSLKIGKLPIMDGPENIFGMLITILSGEMQIILITQIRLDVLDLL